MQRALLLGPDDEARRALHLLLDQRGMAVVAATELESAQKHFSTTPCDVVLATPELAFPVEIAVGILVSIPFTVTIFLGGLSSVPGDIYEAARIDGASSWQQFRQLTLPLLRPFINMAILLNVIYVFNSFPIIWVMTQGGPDNGTHILVTYLYELGFRLGRPGQAAAVSLVMFIMLFVFSVLYLRIQPSKEGEPACM